MKKAILFTIALAVILVAFNVSYDMAMDQQWLAAALAFLGALVGSCTVLQAALDIHFDEVQS